MGKEKIPPKERMAAPFKQVSSAAVDLNLAADELNQRIAAVAEFIEKLNVTVPAWHKIAGGYNPHDGDYWRRDIGYNRVEGQWCIALRDVKGNEAGDGWYHEDQWPFDRAPFWMRVESAGKLPELLDELHKKILETASRLRVRSREVEEFLAAITEIASEKPMTAA